MNEENRGIVDSRFAEALIIRGGQELLMKTQARFSKQAAGEGNVSSVALIYAVAMGSWDKMVQHCGLDS